MTSNSNSTVDDPTTSTMSSKDLHDLALKIKPEGDSHDESSCKYCQETRDDHTGGNVSKTYTEEELKIEVAEATKALADRVAELESAKAADEVDARVTELKAEYEEKIADLQKVMDDKVIEAEGAKTELENTLSYLTAEDQAKTETEEAEARKAERVAQVKEASNFPDDYLDANAERWSKATDEEFAAMVEDYKINTAKAEKTEKVEIPAKTELKGTRETSNQESIESPLRLLVNARSAGIDLRRI